MRIVIVTNEFVTEKNFDGGISNHFYRLALGLLKMGHEPIVVVPSNHNKVFKYNGIEVHRVKINREIINFINKVTYGSLGAMPFWIYQSWILHKEVKKINSEKKISVVQYASYMATSLFCPQDIPTVSMVASYEPILRERKGIDRPSWSQLCLEWLENIALKRVSRLFAPSKLIASIVNKKIKRRVSVIETPFILDIKEYDESLYNNKLKDKKYLLFFGSVGYLKGAKTIADSLYQFFKTNPDFYFVFVGKDVPFKNKSMIKYINEKADTYKSKIIYLKPLDHEKLYPIIEHAEAVVLPSRIDNLPNACIEAMALKKIVIGTNGTSFEQLIVDNENGFLCDVDDSGGLLKLMNKVIRLDDQKKKEIGEKAYQRIQKLHPNIVVSQLVSLYTHISKQ